MKIQTIILVVAVGALFLADFFGPVKYCSFSCLTNYDGLVFNWLVFIGCAFTFSAALNFLPPKIFSSWWKFARIAIPVILILSTLINLQLHHRSGGLFNMDNIFDIPALVLMYAVFVIGSVIQVVRGYQSK